VLESAHRSDPLLAEGFKSHRGRLLAMFDVESVDYLDGIEREAVPWLGCRI
jgi:hypothetical protein